MASPWVSLASFPGPRSASNRKLGEGLGARLARETVLWTIPVLVLMEYFKVSLNSVRKVGIYILEVQFLAACLIGIECAYLCKALVCPEN